MKAHTEQSHKGGTLPVASTTLEKQSDWWKHNHPHTKQSNSPVFTNNVKTGFWKTYNVRSSGKK